MCIRDRASFVVMDVNTPRMPRDGHEERRPRSFIASEPALHDAQRPNTDPHPDQDRLLRPVVIKPNNFDPHGGLGETGWNREYWPSGTHDEYGNRKLAWPDPQTEPEGFISPKARRPAILEPGMVIDRFGSGFGRFALPPDSPYPDRGLH